MTKRTMLFAAYFVASFGILNLAFPMTKYFSSFPGYSKAYIVSSFLLLALATTLFAAIAFPLSVRGEKSIGIRVARSTIFYFVLVSGFAIACSGLGFGLSLGDLPVFGRLSFFFSEWEWARFIFESALPLSACAGALYLIAARSSASRGLPTAQ